MANRTTEALARSWLKAAEEEVERTDQQLQEANKYADELEATAKSVRRVAQNANKRAHAARSAREAKLLQVQSYDYLPWYTKVAKTLLPPVFGHRP